MPGELHRAEIDDADRAAQGISQVGGTTPHRLATIISAATILAAAKKGASWAREISWTSRSGETVRLGLARR